MEASVLGPRRDLEKGNTCHKMMFPDLSVTHQTMEELPRSDRPRFIVEVGLPNR